MDCWIELARVCTANGDELVLRERGGCVALRCNGWELMSNRAHHSEEALAILACESIATLHTGNGQGTSPPLEGGRWGEGWPQSRPARVGAPPPTPLPQGEGEGAAPCYLGRPDQAGQSGNAPHVLIGGLGLGYTLRAALDHLPQTAQVTVAELLPEIVALNRGPLAPLAGHPLADTRVSVACTDIAALLHAAAPATFDAIVLDTDNGPDSVMLQGNAALYQPESLRAIRRALRAAGTLAVWSADPSPRFEDILRASGFRFLTHEVPARGAPGDPLHTIYLARTAA